MTHPTALRVLQLVSQGYNDSQIARLVRRDRTTVLYWRQKLGLASPYDPRKIEEGKLIALFQNGLNDCQIARRLGVCPAVIHRRRHKLGFPPHTPQTATKDWGLKRGEWQARQAA